jgi:hypothetical protein
MEAGFITLIAILAFAVGVTVGIFITRVERSQSDSQGVLYVNCDAPEGQGLFLVQEVATTDIASRKRVMFDVHVIK